jgi:OOP family OmpA-OmpF porin
MNEHPEYTHIEVQGHADSRGDAGFNQRLSDGRARAVMDFLVEQVGVDRQRLTAAGFGNTQPLTAAGDPRSLYMNRRVEFSITREGSSAPAVPADTQDPSSTPNTSLDAQDSSSTPEMKISPDVKEEQ